MTAPSAATLTKACKALSEADPALARAYKEVGAPTWRKSDPCYETLARAIAYQQISTKAADTIWGRVHTHLEADICPARVLASDDDDLRACGLSRPKVRYLKTIAEAVDTGALCFDRLQTSDMDTARKELVAVVGIGVWTAEIFLMNAVGKLDAFPHGDIGLIESYRLLSDAEERHDLKAFSDLAENWRPYRGVAAHLLWDWINQMRDKAYP